MTEPAPPIVTTGVTTTYSSPWWTVEEHTVIENGRPGLYNVLRCGDGVCVLPVTGSDVWLIREYKYAIGQHILQLPSGSIDEDEKPLAAAARELLEETGLRAEAWRPLGIIYPYPTNVASAVHLFIAQDARPVQDPEPGVELVRVSRTRVANLIANHDITHAGSLVCLLTYLARQDRASAAG